MNYKNSRVALGLILLVFAFGYDVNENVAWAGVNVLQSRYDLHRTGANTQETILNTSNVNVKRFGLLFSYPVDGEVYAQPLYMSNLNIPGIGRRNVVYVATMNDVVYALDADSNASADGGVIWVRDFRNPKAGVTQIRVADLAPKRSIERFVGIESTPVIDARSRTLYLVVRTQENAAYVQRLHALDLATGQEKDGSPVTITGTYQGITFDPKIHNQRPGLALASGQVIISWASHQDLGPYYGWVMAYDTTTLVQTGVFTATTSARGGGIWASGRAPAVINNSDGGQDIIVFTGNGFGTAGYDGMANFSQSALRLRIDPTHPSNSIELIDWFTPDNWQYLDSKDLDLSGSGPLILPQQGYIIGGEKEGVMYVIDPNNMGKLQAGNPQLIQSFIAVSSDLHIMGGPVVWDRRSIGKPLILYHWGESDSLKAYTFKRGKFDTQNVTTAKEIIQGHPGGILTLSANGTTSRTGIVWALGSHAEPALRSIKQGILRAYDAENVSRLLWSSRMDAADDSLAFAKFTPPTVANGKVYVATFSNQLLVYGLLPKSRPKRTYVKIISRVGNKVLEVAGASQLPGARVQINTDNGSARQRWEMKTLSNGDRRLISVASRLRLDNAQAGQTDGIPVQIWPNRPKQGRSAQAWTVIPTNNRYVKLVSRENARALTISDTDGTDGALIWTQVQNGQITQDWKIVVQPDAGVTECNTSAVQLVSALPRARLLTVAPKKQVWTDDPNGTPAQTWKMNLTTSGNYEFRSVANGLVLTAINGNETDGLSVELLPSNGATSQEWEVVRIVDRNDTFSYVMSAVDGKALTVEDGNAANNTPVVTSSVQETLQQQWRIQDTNSLWCLYDRKRKW